ncbi:AHH domain-containing protein [Croceibacterium ferulae]|uniref:AHH domain-containing protein n=1 Tax=Croceibacterium ferulae TaxID=1854641 RepID=UPI000EABE72E|nr:AHH domain-containing protein [Croceibacterium ferulae]
MNPARPPFRRSGARAAIVARPKLPFPSVNNPGQPGYRTGMQRHHLLPRQLLSHHAHGRLFDEIGRDRIGFDDFRSNGLLLPSTEGTAQQTRMPLHRGPHHAYNAMVAERMGQIESDWSRMRPKAPEIALDQAIMRIDLLQRALRRRLLAEDRTRFKLNRRDRLGEEVDFTVLDAMAELLWNSTEPGLPPDVLIMAGEPHPPLEPAPAAQKLDDRSLIDWIFG